MGKSLIIKGTDFSENAVNSPIPMEVFNTASDGKFKIAVNKRNECQFLNLSNTSGAANWCIEYIDVTSYRGKTLSIEFNGLASTDNKDVVFLNVLLDAIEERDYSKATFNIGNTYVTGYYGFPTEDSINVVVPNDAVIMYVSYIDGNRPNVREVM